MKALILTQTDSAYDYYEAIVTNVYLVPDDFRYRDDHTAFWQKICSERPSGIQFKTDGQPFYRSRPKIAAMYAESLKARFGEMPFVTEDDS